MVEIVLCVILFCYSNNDDEVEWMIGYCLLIVSKNLGCCI